MPSPNQRISIETYQVVTNQGLINQHENRNLQNFNKEKNSRGNISLN